MTAPPSSLLQNMLRTAVQTVQWTYSLFWQLSPQQGNLIWADGYYNGAIKTRKTVQPMEVSAEEASLSRSQQLRELYESLSAGEANQATRRPSAALSPEDLTESEWFYLMCVSFSFTPGVGLPGKAYAKRQHVWLIGANEVDSKVFSRAILAKSARIQTVVCIPLLDGVVELGTTERVQEDHGFLQHIKSFFSDQRFGHPQKPALSEHSTSNPTATLENTDLHSPPLATTAILHAPTEPSVNANQTHNDAEEEEEEDEEEDDDDEVEAAESDSETETDRNSRLSGSGNPQMIQTQGVAEAAAVEPSELMQLEMSEDIRLGSPDDGSNNLDSDLHLLAVSQAGNQVDQQRTADCCYKAESNQRWPLLQEPMINSFQLSPSEAPQLEELTQEDTHYSQTVSTILQQQSSRWSESSFSAHSGGHILYTSSPSSAFIKWSTATFRSDLTVVGGQWLLKNILFNLAYLHAKYRDETSSPKFRKGTPQEELSANHVLAERRRREKLNERFIILRSLVPFVTKMDKASILGDTIEYVKQLRMRIQELEARAPTTTTTATERQSGMTRGARLAAPGPDKRKLRIVEGSGGPKPRAVVEPQGAPQVEVSIIESDGLVEMQCPYREGLLLDVMQLLRELRMEIIAVQSSLNNGVFVAELRAKVKEDINGRKTSIMEVKKAINQIIPQN